MKVDISLNLFVNVKSLPNQLFFSLESVTFCFVLVYLSFLFCLVLFVFLHHREYHVLATYLQVQDWFGLKLNNSRYDFNSFSHFKSSLYFFWDSWSFMKRKNLSLTKHDPTSMKIWHSAGHFSSNLFSLLIWLLMVQVLKHGSFFKLKATPPIRTRRGSYTQDWL